MKDNKTKIISKIMYLLNTDLSKCITTLKSEMLDNIGSFFVED